MFKVFAGILEVDLTGMVSSRVQGEQWGGVLNM